MSQRELTVPELQQASDFLVPIVQQALRPEFDKMNNQMLASNITLTNDFDKKLAILQSQVTILRADTDKLQKSWGRVMMILGWVSFGFGLLAPFLKEWGGKLWAKLSGH